MTAPFPTCRIGLDLGSVSLDCVVLDAADRVVFTHYARTGGRPLQATLAARHAMAAALGDATVSGVVVTGSGKEMIARAAGLATRSRTAPADLRISEMM